MFYINLFNCNSIYSNVFITYFILFSVSIMSSFSKFSFVVLLRLSRRGFYFIASFIRGSIADSGFCTFARDPYETCKGHSDEKVEKRVQVARYTRKRKILRRRFS